VRTSSVVLCVFVLAFPVYPANTVTVAQLEQFLTSSRAARLSDTEIAERLSRVDLSEELTSKSLARIVAESLPGPETQQQLELLAAVSVIQPPPRVELPGEPAPDQSTKQKIVRSARDYARNALHIVPNYLAVRETLAFNNLPTESSNRHKKPTIEMHFANETRSGIAVRNGREVSSSLPGHEDSDHFGLSSGLSSWGEFGAVLAVILGDASDESLHWHRWQRNESGMQMAVFGYKIPRSSSHYTVDFCCYRQAEDDAIEHAFRDKPGYHGEIYINPANGEVVQITLEADLSETDPVSRSAVAVEYGHVMIGGKRYVCPVRSVAILEGYNADIKKIDGIGLERHVNEVKFTDYHKFGSTVRILTSADGTEQH